MYSGYGLNADMIKNLVNAGIDEIAFSLETLNAKKHDSLRGTDGLFETIISSIDQIKQLSPRVRIGLNTIIMAETLERVLKVAETFAAKHSTKDHEFLLAAGSSGIEAATNIVVKQANRTISASTGKSLLSIL